MNLTKREQGRYRAIVRELSRLSSRGWDSANHSDYFALEVELRQLGDKAAKPKGQLRTAILTANRTLTYWVSPNSFRATHCTSPQEARRLIKETGIRQGLEIEQAD